MDNRNIRDILRRLDGDSGDDYQRGLHELRDVRDTPHPARRVHQRDQPVGLAAAIGGVETEDRGGLAGMAKYSRWETRDGRLGYEQDHEGTEAEVHLDGCVLRAPASPSIGSLRKHDAHLQGTGRCRVLVPHP